MQLAKDQARRDGAAMVWSRRKAMERVGLLSMSDEVGSMAFTCVINTEAAHLHVHWAEEIQAHGDGGRIKIDWFMAVLKRYHLEEEDNVVALRRALHIILNWGLSERLAVVRAQVDLYCSQQGQRDRELVDDDGGGFGSARRNGKRRRV